MIWKICYIISVTVLAVSIVIYIRQSRFKRIKQSSALKTLFVGFLVGLFTLLLPIQLDNYGTGFSAVVKSVLAALNRALRAFVLTDISFMGKEQSISEEFYPVYSVTLMVLCFVCPFISLGYLLTFFSKLRASLRFAFSRLRPMCVFSCLNEGSLALAQDLYRKHPSWQMVFCSISDTDKGTDDYLFDSAEKIRAICFAKDIHSVNLQVHSKRKQMLIFAISDDEQKNTNDALELLSKYRGRGNIGLYFFSSLTESTLMLSDVDPGMVKVRRIDMHQNLIDRFLYDRGEILFKGAAECPDGSRRISAVIVGLGSSGVGMIKALTWYCQMYDYTLTIDGFDLRGNAEDCFRAECPDILNPIYNGVATEGEANYTVRIHSGVDIWSDSFQKMLSDVEHPTFAFVSLGDDSANIDISIKLRTLFERRGIQPDICTVIRNSDKKQMLDRAKNYKNQEYRIHSIGDIPSSYTEQEILSSEIEEEALKLHKEWGEEESFWRYEYYYRSSVVRAIYNKALSELFPPEQELSEQQKQALIETEHKRWNAYMRTQGYIFSGSTDKASRNDLAKLHNDLVPYQALDEAEKKKDQIDLRSQLP